MERNRDVEKMGVKWNPSKSHWGKEGGLEEKKQ